MVLPLRNSSEMPNDEERTLTEGRVYFTTKNIGQILLPLNSVAQLPKFVLRSLSPGDDEATDYTAHYAKEKLNQMQLLLYNSKTELSVFLNYFWFLFPSPLSTH